MPDVASWDATAGRATGPRHRNLGASVFVWAVWAAMLAAALLFVRTYGSNVPSWDEWDMVPTLTGEQPVTLSWLWSEHNEHRVPLPRLFFLALNKAFGRDIRTTMYCNVVALGVLSLAMMLGASRARGQPSYTDAFFPVVLLHLGHAHNLLWGWQLQFVASTALAAVALLAVVLSGDRVTPRAAGIITGACALLLPLCGVNGLALAPLLATWLLYVAVLQRRSLASADQRSSAVLVGLAVAALLLVALYLVGYESVPFHRIRSSVRPIVSGSARFLTGGLGPAMREIWPWSGLGTLSLLLAGIALLARVWRRSPRERQRAAGLLSFLGAMGCLALAIGMSRDGFEPRYVLLAAPVWCAMYFALSLYAPPRLNGWARALLLVVAGLVLWPNTRRGIEWGRTLRAELGAFERDLADGVPPYRLINRYAGYLHPHHAIPGDYLPMLRRAGIGQYRRLQPDPPFREIALPLEPTAVSQVTWKEDTAYGVGNAPSLVFALPGDTYAAGIRLTYAASDGRLPYVTVYWRSSEEPDFTRAQSWKQSPTGDRANWARGTWTRRHDEATTMDVWVCDSVKEIRVDPDVRPGVSRIARLVVLVPVE